MYSFILKHMKPGDMFPVHVRKTHSRRERDKLTRRFRVQAAQMERHGLVMTCRITSYGLDIYCIKDHGTRRHVVDENIRRIFCRQVSRVPRYNKPGLLKGVRSKEWTSYVRSKKKEERERIHT